LGIDDKLRSKNGPTVRYFLTDHLGSTEALADASGTIVSSTSYDSFGNAASNIATTYRYTGREYDVDTGLYYYRNRWYDPEVGRFISEDPIGFASGDINLYGYVGNNPLSFIDPFGFWRCFPSDPPGGDPPSGWWDVVQGALDAAGLTPGVGLPADLLNAGISYARGNYADAALSMAAAVPIGGTVAGAGKLASRAGKVLRGAANPKVRAAIERGKKAHDEFKKKVDAKKSQGWDSNPHIKDPDTGRYVIPDALTPSKRPVELKPNTPSGRRQGRKQLRKYERVTGKKGRVVYYDP
jgi:RHS repeat-associated protein